MLVSFHAPEIGDINLNGELVFPKFVNVPGWQDILIPRLQIGGMGNVSGGTSYAYAGPVWTVNFDHVFAEIFGGGARCTTDRLKALIRVNETSPQWAVVYYIMSAGIWAIGSIRIGAL